MTKDLKTLTPHKSKSGFLSRGAMGVGLGVVLICACLVGMFQMSDVMISREIVNNPDNVELTEGMNDLRNGLLTFVIVAILLSLVIGIMLEFRIWHQRRQDTSLKETNEQLEASYQQLEASEQQLRATNQQLQASEQQLRASNQQLMASEQQVVEERNRAQRYFDFAGTMLLVLGADGCVLQVNQKGCQILEADESSIVGKDWCDTFLPEHKRASVRAVFAQLSEGEVQSFGYHENPILTAQGNERLIVWHNTILRDEEDRITAILSSGEDVTERRIAEQKIKDADERLRILFDKAPDAIYVCNAEGQLVQVNDRACQVMGYSKEELLGLRVLDIDINHDSEEAFQAFTETLKQSSPTSFESQHRRKSGQTFPVEITISPLHTKEGMHLIAIARDITQRKHAEQAIEKRIIALTRPLDDTQGIFFESLFNLKDLQRLQDEFSQATGVASIITHPDGTPITGSSNFCRLCQDVIRKTDKGLQNCFNWTFAI